MKMLREDGTGHENQTSSNDRETDRVHPGKFCSIIQILIFGT